MTIVGAGAGVSELTALAVTSELAPTRKRGKYVAILIFTIVPFVPSSFYAQIIACELSPPTLSFARTDLMQTTLLGDTLALSSAYGTVLDSS